MKQAILLMVMTAFACEPSSDANDAAGVSAEPTLLEGASWPSAMHAKVEVLDAHGGVLAEGWTDAAGRYAVEVLSGRPERVVIRADHESAVKDASGIEYPWTSGRMAAHASVPVISPLSDLALTLADAQPALTPLSERHRRALRALSRQLNTTVANVQSVVPGPASGPPEDAQSWLSVVRLCVESEVEEHPLGQLELYRQDALDGAFDEGFQRLTGGCFRAARRISPGLLAEPVRKLSLDESALGSNQLPARPVDQAPPEVRVRLEALGPLSAVRGRFEADGLLSVTGRAALHFDVTDNRGIAAVDLETAPPIVGLDRVTPAPSGGPRAFSSTWELDAHAAARLLARDAFVFTLRIRDVAGHVITRQAPVRLGDNGRPGVKDVVGPGQHGPAGRWHTGAERETLAFTLSATSDALLNWEVEYVTDRGEIDAIDRGRGHDGDPLEVQLPVGAWPEGDASVVIRVSNPLGQVQERHLTVRVDRTSPRLEQLPGSYLDERNAQLIDGELFLRNAQRHRWDSNTRRIPVHKIRAAMDNWNPVTLRWRVTDQGTPWTEHLAVDGDVVAQGRTIAFALTRERLAARELDSPQWQPTFGVVDLAGNRAETVGPTLDLHLVPAPVQTLFRPTPLTVDALRRDTEVGVFELHNPWDETLNLHVGHALTVPVDAPAAVRFQDLPLPIRPIDPADLPPCLLADGRPLDGVEVRVEHEQLLGDIAVRLGPDPACAETTVGYARRAERGVRASIGQVRLEPGETRAFPVYLTPVGGAELGLEALLAEPSLSRPVGLSVGLGVNESVLLWDDGAGRWRVGRRLLTLLAVTIEPIEFFTRSFFDCEWDCADLVTAGQAYSPRLTLAADRL